LSPDDEDKTAIAAAFHDLCAFDGLDYIEPSIEEAARYLRDITGSAHLDRAGAVNRRRRVAPSRSVGRRLPCIPLLAAVPTAAGLPLASLGCLGRDTKDYVRNSWRLGTLGSRGKET
jgi:hypothetical protein